MKKFRLITVFLWLLSGTGMVLAGEWDVLYDKAQVSHQQGNYAEGLRIQKRALRIAKREQPANYTHRIINLNNIAVFYNLLGDDAKAMAYYQKALKIEESKVSFNYALVGVTIRGLASLETKRGNSLHAKELYVRAVKILKNALGKDHKMTLGAEVDLAVVYMQEDRYQKAETLLNKVLKRQKKLYGDQSIELVDTLYNLATIYLFTNRVERAESSFNHLLVLFEKSEQPNAFVFSKVLYSMSSMYALQKDYPKAVQMMEQTVSVYRTIYGLDHPKTLEVMGNLLTLYQANHQKKKAVALREEIARIQSDSKRGKIPTPPQITEKKSSKIDKNISASVCAALSKQEKEKLLTQVMGRYPELTPQSLMKHDLNLYYDASTGVSLIVPTTWYSVDENDAILYLSRYHDRVSSRYMLKKLSRSWNDAQAREPQKLLQKIAGQVAQISINAAIENGDSMRQILPIAVFKYKNMQIAHVVLHRTGEHEQWESHTFLWDGVDLYSLSVISLANDLVFGEFLSAIGMESFYSEAGER